MAQDLANSNAQAGTPENQITFKMLTGSGQFNSMEAQVQCPSLLHEQLKEVVLEAWDQITPQRKLTDNYTKISQRPNKAYANFLARLGVAISHNVVEKKSQNAVRKTACIWKYKSEIPKSHCSNSWDWKYYWLFEGQPTTLQPYVIDAPLNLIGRDLLMQWQTQIYIPHFS